MRANRVVRLLIAAGLLGAAVAAGAQAPVGAAAVEYPSIVLLRDGESAAAVAGSAAVDPSSTFELAIDGFAADLTAAEIAWLRADPAVRRIVPDAPAQVVQPDPVGEPTSQPQGIGVTDRPDPYGTDALLAGLQVTVLDTLHALGLGPPAQVTPTAVRRVGAADSPTASINFVDGRVDATIALVDTGIDRHPDLNLVGGKDCVSGGSGGHDHDGYLNRSGQPVGHGTLVAGVAAAIDNTSGVVGVAPGARLLSAKAVDASGQSTTEALLCALEFAMQPEQQTDVINISLAWSAGRFLSSGATCGTDVDPIHEAICSAVDQGISVVVAAGNEGRDVAGQLPDYTATYPAAYPEVVTVSMIADFDGAPGGRAAAPPCGNGQLDDHLRTTSNFGWPVDIAAVGLCVLTTGLGGGTVTSGGTSLSSPAVAGAVALLRAASGHEITTAEVRARLLGGAEPGPIPGDPDGFPEGILDVSDH